MLTRKFFCSFFLTYIFTYWYWLFSSELRLIEVIEEVCDGILKYNVHAERSGSLRYAKGESQTMGTLKGLRDRGVKVELGIPEDLWDTPSAEITNLKKYVSN